MNENAAQHPGKHVIIHASAACLGNPGPGGWAVLLQFMEGPKEIRRKGWRGSSPDATYNSMELVAAIAGLKKITSGNPVVVRSKSHYLVEGAAKQLARWRANGWRTADRPAVANRALWRKLDRVIGSRTVTWERVSDSADKIMRDVDQQARAAARDASR